MKTILFVLASLLWAGPSMAEPVRLDLFTAGTHGFALYRIPGIVITSKGTLLAYCEARRGDSDWSDERLVMRRSTDAGKTWSEQSEVFTLPEPQPMNPLRVELRLGPTNDRTHHNLVLIPDRNGAVHAVFCADYWRSFYSRSDDDGVTWSKPLEITDVIAGYRQKGWNWRVVGNGCGHGLQLDNGRLLVPLWLSSSTQPRGNGHRPSQVGVVFSDDHGATWKIGAWVGKHSPELVTPSETCAVQLSDGSVMFNLRHETTNHFRSVSISRDGATGWSKPVFDQSLFEPVCEASIIRLPKQSPADRNRILFCNPDSRPIDGKERPRRSNLTLKLSYDDGKTWPVQKVLEPDLAAYSDLAVAPDGTIYCLFERGVVKVGTRSRTAALTLAKFDLNWLEGTANTPARELPKR